MLHPYIFLHQWFPQVILQITSVQNGSDNSNYLKII